MSLGEARLDGKPIGAGVKDYPGWLALRSSNEDLPEELHILDISELRPDPLLASPSFSLLFSLLCHRRPSLDNGLEGLAFRNHSDVAFLGLVWLLDIVLNLLRLHLV